VYTSLVCSLLAALLLAACSPPPSSLPTRETPYTLAELEAIQAQALRELDKLDFGVAVFVNVPENRVEVPVSDRAWFEGELQRVGVELPEGVELVEVEGGSTAKEMHLVLTPPVPGIVFPRQQPVEGFRDSMMAELIGTLELDPDHGCLRVRPLYGGEDLLVIWKPEFTLRKEGGRLEVLDADGLVAARVGEEVLLAGGYVPVRDEWVLQQIPPACRGATFVAGYPVRPNLRDGAELFDLDAAALPDQAIFFLRYKPALDEQVRGETSLAGTLVVQKERRCVHLQPGLGTLIWAPDWSLRLEGETAMIVDGAGTPVAQLGDEVRLRARAVPHTMDAPVYAQLIEELPGDCIGATWLVDGVE
jgi:hypothetical protein